MRMFVIAAAPDRNSDAYTGALAPNWIMVTTDAPESFPECCVVFDWA